MENEPSDLAKRIWREAVNARFYHSPPSGDTAAARVIDSYLPGPDDVEKVALHDQLKELAEKATQGPFHLHTGAIGVNPWIATGNWVRSDGSYVRGGCILNMVAHDEREQDAALIVALLNNLPTILAALRGEA